MTAVGVGDLVADRCGESFWDAVATPYLRRRISRDQAVAFVRRAHEAGGGRYKVMARILRVEPEYERMLNFLQYHGLGVRD